MRDFVDYSLRISCLVRIVETGKEEVLRQSQPINPGAAPHHFHIVQKNFRPRQAKKKKNLLVTGITMFCYPQPIT